MALSPLLSEIDLGRSIVRHYWCTAMCEPTRLGAPISASASKSIRCLKQRIEAELGGLSEAKTLTRKRTGKDDHRGQTRNKATQPRVKSGVRQRITPNTVVLLGRLRSSLALIVALELHVRKLTIHSCLSPQPLQLKNHPADSLTCFR